MSRFPMVRLAVMAVLLAVLQIPLVMVGSLVEERAKRRDGAVAEIGAIWGGPQTLIGPVLSVPYRCLPPVSQTVGTFDCNVRANFLPESLIVDAVADPEVRRRSLFEAVVYRSRLTVTGRFARPDLSGLRPEPRQMLWDEATISVGVTDAKGVAQRVQFLWGGHASELRPGGPDVGMFAGGLHTTLATSGPIEATEFSLTIELNGTRELRFVPVGRDTTVRLSSTWPHPSFSGAALPTTFTGDGGGFRAAWTTSGPGLTLPPRWTGASAEMPAVIATATGATARDLPERAAAAAYGVGLLRPVDVYQQTERAVKYAALFIVMTFVVTFLWEVTRDVVVHPVQYMFVGFAMCLFYLLLLSLSEHVGFDRAYLVASGATISLLGWYWRVVLGTAARGGMMAAVLTSLYGFLYLLLRLEDYALLAGSVGLFLMLAVVMFTTRRMDWYGTRARVANEPR